MTPVMAASTFGYYLWRLSTGVAVRAWLQTETFTVLAACQWFNVLNCERATRSALRLGLLKNKWLLGGLALASHCRDSSLTCAPMNPFFHTVPIPRGHFPSWSSSPASCSGSEEARKLVVRARARRNARST